MDVTVARVWIDKGSKRRLGEQIKKRKYERILEMRRMDRIYMRGR